jgi:hypothetical protein
MRYREMIWFDDKARWWARRAVIGALLILAGFGMRMCARGVWPTTAAVVRPPLPGHFELRYARMKAGQAPWQDTATHFQAARTFAAARTREAGR